jgi:predicted GH43/DUF377 family glycosyl hydrolase
MKVEKKGLILAPLQDKWWNQHYCILPTPLYIAEQDVLRIYYATTCKDKFGRITYVDVNPANPAEILKHSDDFILDVGEDGTFDDCGVNVSSVIPINGKYYMYYAGYQRHFKTPYSIFSGVAVANSPDGPFERIKRTPVLERIDSELSIRSAPTVIQHQGKYFMVYVANSGWQFMNNDIYKEKKYPIYNLSLAQSNDAINWEPIKKDILFKSDAEFGFGRPYLVKENDTFYLFYSVRQFNSPYKLGYATSTDLINWDRHDDGLVLEPSASGWDSEMICYSACININGKQYLFYNGNNNGFTGFGFANIII